MFLLTTSIQIIRMTFRHHLLLWSPYIMIIKLKHDTVYTETGIYSTVRTEYWKMARRNMVHGFWDDRNFDQTH